MEIVPFESQASELGTKMWKTAGARFRAAQRLTRRGRISTFSIALLSVLAIAVGVLEPRARSGWSAAALTSIISVFVLVISLIEGSSQTAVQSNKLHENAIRVSECRARLEEMLARCQAQGAQDWQELRSIREEYQTTIRECPFNHEPIDYKRFEVDHRKRKEFLVPSSGADEGKPRMTRLSAQWIRGCYALSATWLSIASWLIILAVLVFAFDWSQSLSTRSAGGQSTGLAPPAIHMTNTPATQP